MSYITTTLQPLKRYPTYSFYARADAKNLELDSVFKICILETLRWLRSRLKDFKKLPDEIRTPEPEAFADFDAPVSFNYENGLFVDVVYVERDGIWSLLMTESDMGANLGQKHERLPVQGRLFNTEIAFRKQQEFVEIGVRTTCSEPANTAADCEVFRPTVVRALSENTNIRLMYSGFILDGKPLEIRSKTELERFFGLYEDTALNFPMLLIADSPTETLTPSIPDLTQKISTPTFPVGGGFSYHNDGNVTLNATVPKPKTGAIITPDKPRMPKEKPVVQKAVSTRLPVPDYQTLAAKLVGFAIVVFVEEKFFKTIENKLRIRMAHGDVILLRRQQELERYPYAAYREDMVQFFRELRADVIGMPKRKLYDFGQVLFHTDAKIRDYSSKRAETSSLEEQCASYQLENAELKKQISEHAQQNTDMQQVAEALRATQKKLDTLQKELDSRNAAFHVLTAKMEQKESAYQRNAELVEFYKKMYDLAAAFPTDKEEVCDWIEEHFGAQIVVLPRARSELRKCSSTLDVAGLCDGIVFLYAYVLFRRQEISEEALRLYAERNNWEVRNCGKETLKMRKPYYTVTYLDQQYLLDLHIKRGVSSAELIRIYFCWEDGSQKILIGSMPEHLPTVRQGT